MAFSVRTVFSPGSAYTPRSRCVREALTRMAAIVSEAVRFPYLERMLQYCCANNIEMVVDPSPKEALSDFFHDWATDCKIIMDDVDGLRKDLLKRIGVLKGLPAAPTDG